MGPAASPVELVLARLKGVLTSNRGWRAECPSCGGRSKKLAVAEATNGSVLLKCFGSCHANQVLNAIGLTLAHLYPPRVSDDSREGRLASRRALREAGWNPAIHVLAREAFVVAAAGFDVARGQELTAEDLARLLLALQRVEDAKLVLCER